MKQGSTRENWENNILRSIRSSIFSELKNTEYKPSLSARQNNIERVLI